MLGEYRVGIGGRLVYDSRPHLFRPLLSGFAIELCFRALRSGLALAHWS